MLSKTYMKPRTNISLLLDDNWIIFFQVFLSLKPPDIVELILGREVNDRLFCIWYSTFLYWNISYECTGSLGMAIYRIMYVKVKEHP